MSQFQILGRRPFPFKAIPIRFAYTNFPDTISYSKRGLPPEHFRNQPPLFAMHPLSNGIHFCLPRILYPTKSISQGCAELF